MLPQLDSSVYFSQLFWLFVCLSVLVWLFKKYYIPRMNMLIERRDNTISGYKSDVEKLEKDIDSAKEEIKRINTEALKKSSEIISAATKKSERILDEQMKLIKKENDELVYGTKKRLEGEIKKLDSAIKFHIDIAAQTIFDSVFEKRQD